MTFDGMIDVIEQHLKNITNPKFQLVEVGEPSGMPNGDLLCAFWYTGRDTAFRTLGDINVKHQFLIRVYWRAQGAAQIRKQIEKDIGNTLQNISDVLSANSQLDGNATDLEITKIEVGYSTIASTPFRILSFEFEVWDYNNSPIVP